MRWQTIGTVKECVVVLIAHTTRFEDGTKVIRIIKCTKSRT
ncbi:hypothetical protein [Photorhabdus cinerea]